MDICSFLLAIVCVAWVCHVGPTTEFMRGAKRRFDAIAQRRVASLLVVWLLAMANCMLASRLQGGLADPTIHDEFSYLLAADTYLHGRLTNPQHPMWRHFETFHVLQFPTYQSKYPPLQGALLALGILVGGHPVVGAWLGVSFGCTAICWMLQGWIPRRWALLSGLLMACHSGVIVNWGNTYWGGAPAMIGGALLLGALRRGMRRPCWYHGVVLAVGVLILANSRPFEGLCMSLPAAALVVRWAWRSKGQRFWAECGRFVLPTGMALAAGAICMMYYNARVTGSPLELPYLHYERTYVTDPNFVWDVPQTRPQYGDFEPEAYLYKAALYRGDEEFIDPSAPIPLRLPDLHKNGRFLKAAELKMLSVAAFYVGGSALLLVGGLRYVLRDRWMQFALISCVMTLLAVSMTTNAFAHYAAPMAGAAALLVVQSMRYVRVWRFARMEIDDQKGRGQTKLHVGKGVIRAAVSCWIIAFFMAIHDPAEGCDCCGLRAPFGAWRSRVLNMLEADDRRHLVMVRYGPTHNVHHEWVYNRADIDNADVIWARDLGHAANRDLLDYFNDRQVWLLEVNDSEPQLVPYEDALSTPTIAPPLDEIDDGKPLAVPAADTTRNRTPAGG